MSFPLIVLVGPTASGKSALAIALARAVDGVIINADAMQIYRECDIVTAKPNPHERASAPHYLLDICAPDQQFSAPQWAERARETIAAVRERGQRPIVCGGTGFYVRALLEPERLSAPAPDEALRARLEARLHSEGAPALVAQLQTLAPDVAARLEARDGYRVVRALQIALQRARGDEAATPPATPLAAQVFALGWPRPQLYERINRRVEAMLQAGALDETRALLGKWGRDAPWAMGVGYGQLIGVLEAKLPPAEAVALWQQASRRYAKRQETWFRHQTAATWLDGTRDVEALAQEIAQTLAP